MSILRFPRMFSTLLSNRHWQGGEKEQSVRKALTMETNTLLFGGVYIVNKKLPSLNSPTNALHFQFHIDTHEP